MEKINTCLDNVLENYRKEIGYKLSDRKNKDAVCIALIILEETSKNSVNVGYNRNLQNKSSVLYNLGKEDLEELVGRAFLSVAPYLESDSPIPYSLIPYLEGKIKLVINKFPHYKSLKGNEIEIENKLREIYRTIGSEILRKLEEMNMIKIIKTEKHENPLIYVEILNEAYKFMKEYEKCRMTDLEDTYKMIVDD